MEPIILRTSLLDRLGTLAFGVGMWAAVGLVPPDGLPPSLFWVVYGGMGFLTLLVVWKWTGGVRIDEHGICPQSFWTFDPPRTYPFRWGGPATARLRTRLSGGHPRTYHYSLDVSGPGGSVSIPLSCAPPRHLRAPLLALLDRHRDDFDERSLDALREFVGPAPDAPSTAD